MDLDWSVMPPEGAKPEALYAAILIDIATEFIKFAPVIKHLLFLCTGNYYRSRFAEELFNHRVGVAGLNWRAFSRALALERGVANFGPISSHALAALGDRGIVPASASRSPMACTIDDFERADLVVAMKETEHRQLVRERFPGWEDRVIYWHVHDLDAAAPEQAIAAIDRYVTSLVHTLSHQMAS